MILVPNSPHSLSPLPEREQVRRTSSPPEPRAFWERALASLDTATLLGINGYHVTAFPGLAPALADLIRQLRLSDLGDRAKAAYVAEVLTCLQNDGAVAARLHCLGAVAQLECEYARRRVQALRS